MFFGEKHGKSPCDALFSRLKRLIYKIIFKENSKLNNDPFIVKNSSDLFQICKLKLEHSSNEITHHAISFHHIESRQLRRNDDPTIKTVQGTKKFHSAMNTGNRLEIKCRKTGCVCKACMQGNSQNCENSAIVDPWVLRELVPRKKSSKLYDVKRLPSSKNFWLNIVVLGLFQFSFSMFLQRGLAVLIFLQSCVELHQFHWFHLRVTVQVSISIRIYV
jgi:hypothetical protein